MMLAQGLLHDSEVTQRIKMATREADIVLPILGHPVMRPDAGFIELPTGLVSGTLSHHCQSMWP